MGNARSTRTMYNSCLTDIDEQLLDSPMITAILKDDGEGASNILCNNRTDRGNPNTGIRTTPHQPPAQKWHIALSPSISCIYSPDKPWCLAAVYNARNVMRALYRARISTSETNRHGNNLLHCLVAYASTVDDEMEREIVSTADFIQNLIGAAEYKTLLLAENEDGLRPLELAAHLCTFSLYIFFFNTKEVYVAKEEIYKWHTIRYYDITEYLNGSRFFRSPIHLMLQLDNEKIGRDSVKEVYLQEPMRSWIKIIYDTNMPYIYIWGTCRVIYVVAFCFYLSVIDRPRRSQSYDSNGNLFTQNETVFSSEASPPQNSSHNGETVDHVLCNTMHVCSLLLLYSCVGLLWDCLYVIRNVFFRPSWLFNNVQGKKCIAVYYHFYRWVQFVTLISVAIVVIVSFEYSYSHQVGNPILRDMFILIAVFVCVWDLLFFLQLTPVIDIYVVAVQRMLNAFANFGFLFGIFFLPYVFGFANLYFENRSSTLVVFYKTFLVILNMEKMPEEEFNVVSLLHVAYIFMVAILLLNFLIAILGATYDDVIKHKAILMQLQYMSVALFTEEISQRVVPSFHNWLRKRHATHEGDRFFLTQVITKPRHKNTSDRDTNSQ